MGLPKQLLPWNGSTLLNHTLTQAELSIANEVHVVLGANADKIKKSIESSMATVHVYHEWDSGLGSSIAYGVKQIIKNECQIDGLLIMLSDQPEVDSNYLNSLIQMYIPKMKQIAATSYSSNLGVPAIFDVCYFDELVKLNGDTGAKQIIINNSANVIAFVPEKYLIDIDTLETYEMLIKGQFKNH